MRLTLTPTRSRLLSAPSPRPIGGYQSIMGRGAKCLNWTSSAPLPRLLQRCGTVSGTIKSLKSFNNSDLSRCPSKMQTLRARARARIGVCKWVGQWDRFKFSINIKRLSVPNSVPPQNRRWDSGTASYNPLFCMGLFR